MAYPQLSFAPDRRSVQSTFYHFNERGSGEPDRHGFSHQDSLIYNLNKVYETKFANISHEYRRTLVEMIVANVSLDHNNLTMLAAATYIVYHMISRGIYLNVDSNNYASPQCDSPQQYCITDSSPVVACKIEANSRIDQGNRLLFESYYNFIEPFIMSDLSGKNPDEISQIRIQYKITLLRYIILMQDKLRSSMISTQG